MSRRDNLEETIKLVGQLLNLTEANQEIAVMRIGRVRETVLATRSFEEGLSAVYSSVLISHRQALAEEQDKDDIEAKQAAILLSSNERFAGLITKSTTGEFVEFSRSNPSVDIIIVGQVGRELWELEQPDTPYFFFDLPEQAVSLKQIRPLLTHLLQYQDLTVFYPRYASVVTQQPVIRQLGSSIEAATRAAQDPTATAAHYLFEPSLENVLDFFNTQIFSIVVKKLFEETELAMLGSRITAMENAAYKIRERIEDLDRLEKQIRRRENNRKQRERLAGMRLWHT